MTKLNLIQVGVGGWGESWASIARQSEDFEVVAYVDVSKANLQRTAAKNGIPSSKCYTDLGRVLKEVDADAVLGVVPANYHSEVAIAALNAGMHVLIEKPLADTMENCEGNETGSREDEVEVNGKPEL